MVITAVDPNPTLIDVRYKPFPHLGKDDTFVSPGIEPRRPQLRREEQVIVHYTGFPVGREGIAVSGEKIGCSRFDTGERKKNLGIWKKRGEIMCETEE